MSSYVRVAAHKLPTEHEDAKTLPALRKRCEDVANTLIDEWMNVSASDRASPFVSKPVAETVSRA